MDNFEIKIGDGEFAKVDDIGWPNIIDDKTKPNVCVRNYWECFHDNKFELEGFISSYVRERMDTAAEIYRHKMLFGDFVSNESVGLPKLDSILTKPELSRIQQAGRGLRGKYAVSFREMCDENPNLSVDELVKLHQIKLAMADEQLKPYKIQFTEGEAYLAEPETKTVQYRGFTFTEVPGWVKYVTTDYYGDIYGYENKPKFLDVAAVWTNVGGGRDCRLRKALVKGAYAPENSLVEL